MLGVFRTVPVPARIARIEPARDGTGALLPLRRREPDGREGEARLEVPDGRGLAPGRRVMLQRGERPALARCSHATPAAAVLGGVAVLWVALYLPFL